MTLREAQDAALRDDTVYYNGSPYTIYGVGVRFKRRENGAIWRYEYIDLLDRNGISTVSARPKDVKETFNDATTSTE